MMRHLLLRLYTAIYALSRPLIFRQSAQDAHHQAMQLLSTTDRSALMLRLLGGIRRITLKPQPLTIGGVKLASPFILAAGFVKGTGFESEIDALAAVERGDNIIPGWRTMPRLVGAVEFGSFTRYPRLGNPGIVLWRDAATRSTQNRVGLKNPGAQAAAAFLRRHQTQLPAQFGINIAVSPGVTDADQERREVLESIAAFMDQGVIPSWFTLNLSCPNTEDDPGGNQTEDKARDLCGAAVEALRPYRIPLWAKIGPDLSETQYHALIAALESVGARAIIATNTVSHPAPTDPTLMAGVGGGRLHDQALQACSLLMNAKMQHDYKIDVIACGGVLDAASYGAYNALGIHAVQYWSALIYRGPLAAAVLADEAR